MMKSLFNERLLDREHGSALLHVGSVMAWAKSKGLHLNQTQPIDGYEFVQAECLVVALARQAEDLTPDQAREIVLADPVLKNNPRFLNYPNDIDPVFCKRLLGGDANVRWRAVLNSAIAEHELVLLDFGSKLPIAAPPAQTAEAAAPEVLTAEPTQATQAARKLSREDGRLSECETRGIVFDRASAHRLPDGVGAAAKKMNITRQSLSTDLKAALRRRFEAARSGKG